MINFDEELRKFPQAMEIEEVGNAVNNHEFSDVTDMIIDLVTENRNLKNQQQQVVVQTVPVQPLQ